MSADRRPFRVGLTVPSVGAAFEAFASVNNNKIQVKTMARFQPGQSGNPQGRPVGSRNRATSEIKEILDQNVEFEDVIKKLFERAQKGNERAAELLLQYRFGRPTARDELTLRNEPPDSARLERAASEALAELREHLVNDV